MFCLRSPDAQTKTNAPFSAQHLDRECRHREGGIQIASLPPIVLWAQGVPYVIFLTQQKVQNPAHLILYSLHRPNFEGGKWVFYRSPIGCQWLRVAGQSLWVVVGMGTFPLTLARCKSQDRRDFYPPGVLQSERAPHRDSLEFLAFHCLMSKRGAGADTYSSTRHFKLFLNNTF